MLRTFGAILLGLAAAVAIMLALEYAAMAVFPPPAGLDLQSEEDLARLVESAGTGKLLSVLLGWCAANFGGAWLAARVAHGHRAVAAYAVGALMVAGVAINVAMLPHPLWTTVAGLALPLPLAWLALRLVARPRPRPRPD
ncbi:hypothetical protein QFW77_15695 [Luteimonas sp. RD2P54]|uniref:Uncharacterized protein n=1 Tax=Luteimonas endophytica TaxID=3042023 RepID=A0ABT6JC74_9GAMM|nr:hypothetical protein [Luteimonas endophytica]MDH5824417.1 hypothetical protein [Luteimonas endophytica]